MSSGISIGHTKAIRRMKRQIEMSREKREQENRLKTANINWHNGASYQGGPAISLGGGGFRRMPARPEY